MLCLFLFLENSGLGELVGLVEVLSWGRDGAWAGVRVGASVGCASWYCLGSLGLVLGVFL